MTNTDSKETVKLFIKEFIQAGRDSQVPLDDTYLIYIDFMRERFPKEKPVTASLYHRITTDYFYKKKGTKNNKAVSIEQLERDLMRKQAAIFRDMEVIKRITENRKQLLGPTPHASCCHQTVF
jgi:hypothetical protein